MTNETKPPTDEIARGPVVSDHYTPALWERILAAVCAIAILVLVFIVVLRKDPFTDDNQVVLIRIALSLAVGVIGAVVPGFLQVDLKVKGIAIRAGGALALFVITFFFSPNVLPLAASKEHLERIEKTGEETRSDVGRMLTKFNSIFVQAVYELPNNEPDVQLLKTSITEIVQAIKENRKPHPPGLTLSYSYSYPDGKSSELPVVSIDLDHILDEEFLALSPRLIDIAPFLTFLRQPRLQIGINKSPVASDALVSSLIGLGDPPDLHIFVHSWPVDADNGNFGKVIWDAPRQRVLVDWNGFDYPSDKWATSRQVISIQDLDKSQFVGMLSNASVDHKIEQIVSKCIPIWVNISFDNNFVTLSKFSRIPPISEWQAFSAIFPSTQDILDGKASHPSGY